MKAFVKQIEKKRLHDFLSIERSGCLGVCQHGPVVKLREGNTLYGNVKAEDCKKILKRHLAGRKPIKRLILKAKGKKK